MSKTIKLIPTNYATLGSGSSTILNNPDNALTGIDDDTSAELQQQVSTSGGVRLTGFVGPNGETVADLASKIGHVNSISFKTKYQADPPTLPSGGASIEIPGWGVSDGYSATPSPQIVEIPFNGLNTVSSVDEYWQAVVEDDLRISVDYYASTEPTATAGAIVNIYGAEMEINYEPKGESGKIDPNSIAEVIYGDSGSTKTYDVELKDLRVENGKLNGTAVGVAQKSFTGRLDQIKFSFTDVPFDGVGGGSGSGVTTLVVSGTYTEGEEGSIGVANVEANMTFAQLEEAVLNHKPVLCIFNFLNDEEGAIMSMQFNGSFKVVDENNAPFLDRLDVTHLISISAASSSDTGTELRLLWINLLWTRKDLTPRVTLKTVTK